LKATKISKLGMLLAFALILSYVESLLPMPFMIPGMKLGLANLCIVLILYLYDWKEALLINILRILLVSFMFTNMFSLAYSLAGAVLSLLFMAIMKWSKLFNLITISTAGGIAHNIGQLVVSCFVFSNMNLLYYGPVLVLSGLITGLVIGIVSLEILKRNTKL
jgi:heptaprenyl diphosphate synthase